ncbi:MAG: SDR family NAD(P)-dependent oxidoreductase [Candidatus Latescibacteria bacterium]|nr:SDR family NAD(P)-dependent oxidoreductase [Candidatus Latescibacterota bacterium]
MERLFYWKRLSQAFAPILAANGGGGLVNVISVAGLVNFPLFITYSASKAALHSLTQALRLELAGQGVFVAGVYPGPVDTDMAADVPFEKTSPAVVADNILQGLEAGQEEIFPDGMAGEMGAGYEQSPKGLEQKVATMVASMAA